MNDNAAPVSVREDEREVLEALRTGQQTRLAQRAAIILHVSEGRRYRDVQADLGVSPNTITRWVRAFRDGGVEGLVAEPSVGRPRSEEVVAALAEVNSSPDAFEQASVRRLAKDLGLSASTVSRHRTRARVERLRLSDQLSQRRYPNGQVVALYVSCSHLAFVFSPTGARLPLPPPAPRPPRRPVRGTSFRPSDPYEEPPSPAASQQQVDALLNLVRLIPESNGVTDSWVSTVVQHLADKLAPDDRLVLTGRRLKRATRGLALCVRRQLTFVETRAALVRQLGLLAQPHALAPTWITEPDLTVLLVRLLEWLRQPHDGFVAWPPPLDKALRKALSSEPPPTEVATLATPKAQVDGETSRRKPKTGSSSRRPA